MECGHSRGDVMKKRMSLGLSVADEKIKLIDVLCEDDDYFLVASPSLQSSISEFERMEQKQVKESRPSFLRRSLAWDSAFFNNSGVLDADELFFINNGANETSLLPANHEVRNRIFESENDVGFSADWFEIQPSTFESKPSKALNVAERRSSKSGLKQNLQSSKKFDRSSINKTMINTYQTSIGKSIDAQNQSKLKKESSTRRTPGNKDFSGLSNLKTDNKSITTFLGQEKSTHRSCSSNLQPNPSPSSAKFCHTFSQTPLSASTLSKRETESKKSPTSNISRLSSIRKKWISNLNTSTHSTSSYSSPANSTRLFPSATLLSPVHKQRRSVDSKDVKEASNLQKSLQIPKQNGSLTAKSMRPSGLRPPSPLHSFFDEGTPHHTERSRKMPQKKLKNVPSAAIDEQNGMKELDTLCRNFEAVALESGGVKSSSVSKEEDKQQNSKGASSRRTPLADKTSKYNFATTMEAKKEKLVRRSSSVRYS